MMPIGIGAGERTLEAGQVSEPGFFQVAPASVETSSSNWTVRFVPEIWGQVAGQVGLGCVPGKLSISSDVSSAMVLPRTATSATPNRRLVMTRTTGDEPASFTSVAPWANSGGWLS